MNYFDDENKVIKHFQHVMDKDVFFPLMTEKAKCIYECIHDRQEWEKWIYSARKSDPPPDYYNDDMWLMMDVMRVDDHAYINEKSKTINPTNIGESVLQKEIKKSGILELFPADVNVIAIPHTHLATNDDHNYLYYIENFKRVVKEHIRKIDLYKKNHPGYKTIFFVLDESSAYIQSSEKVEESKPGDKIAGIPHIQFIDNAFLSIFTGTQIDYLIWFSPYKLINGENGRFELPVAAVYDMSNMAFKREFYESDKMMSSEV